MLIHLRPFFWHLLLGDWNTEVSSIVSCEIKIKIAPKWLIPKFMRSAVVSLMFIASLGRLQF